MKNLLIKRLVITGVLFSTPVFASTPESPKALPSGISILESLVYTDTKLNEPLTMDLFMPQKSETPVPCILVIQGGGFFAQDGQKFRHFAEFFAENGFAAALIAYRGRPNHTYTETMADVKAAVRFIRKFSDQYGIDPDRIGAMGRSAGGTLAVLLAVTGEVEDFEGTRGHPGVSSRIQAAAGMAGVYDFVARFTDPKQIKIQPQIKKKIQTNGKWIGMPFSSENKHWKNASAVNHIDPSDPSILLLHSKDDPTVPWMQSYDLFLKIKKAGMDPEIKLYETGGHAVQPRGAENPLARMAVFFKKSLATP